MFEMLLLPAGTGSALIELENMNEVTAGVPLLYCLYKAVKYEARGLFSALICQSFP